MRHLKYNVWHNETFKYNVWHNETFSNTMCDTMRHLKLQCVTQWDILKYNVWHNETF